MSYDDCYDDFLERKRERAPATGFEVNLADLNPNLFDYQAATVKWNIRQGNILCGQAVGMGKTIQLVESAKIKQDRYGGKVLMIAPLAVAHQTIAEAKRLSDVEIIYVQSQADVEKNPKCDFFITNQDHVLRDKFDHTFFNLLSLDEASKMLKDFTGKTRKKLTYKWGPVKHKDCWTATFAPNRLLETLNYAEFLGIKTTGAALTKWFINDAKLKGVDALHLSKVGEAEFWEWLASWCIVAGKPSDLGFSDEGHELPEYEIHYEKVQTDMSRAFEQVTKEGQHRLIPNSQLSATNMWADKRATVKERARMMAEVVNRKPNENWFLLTDTDYERDEVNGALADCCVVTGGQHIRTKEDRLLGFARGEIPRLLTKPDIAGFGLNFQYHCHNMALIGLTHKFEVIHQVCGRIVRPRQAHKCHIHIILPDSEIDILANIQRKQRQHEELQQKMIPAMKITGILAQTSQKYIVERESHIVPMVLPAWLKTQGEGVLQNA